MQTLATGLSVLAVIWLTLTANGYRRGIAKARRSGLPYTVIPVSPLQPLWQLFALLFRPWLELLPRPWIDWWYPLCLIPNHWKYAYLPFKIKGADTFMSVSSNETIVHTCDPDFSRQILTQGDRDLMIKPPELVGIVNTFGPSVVGTNFDEGRLYRKLTMPAMSERTNHNVWESAIEETSRIVTTWTADGRTADPLEDIGHMALAVMCRVCYGKELQEIVPSGHRLSFAEAITTVMDKMPIYLLTPPAVLKYSPLDIHRRVKLAFEEWDHFMRDMWTEETERQKTSFSDEDKNSNLLGTIINNFAADAGSGTSTNNGPPPLRDPTWGNMFIFLVAGHETSSNTIHYALLLLACYPQIQRDLQASLDSTLGGKPLSAFKYNEVWPVLMKGLLGAVIMETLRLWTVIPFVPKKATADATVTVAGEPKFLPKGTLIYINVSASHRNPAHWPHEQSATALPGEPMPKPVGSFDPYTWLSGEEREQGRHGFFEPEPYSFLPFSAGPRNCMGRRFAEVEMAATLGTMMQNCTVELDAPAGDEEAWERVRREAMTSMTNVSFKMSLKPDRPVALRVRPRNRA